MSPRPSKRWLSCRKIHPQSPCTPSWSCSPRRTSLEPWPKHHCQMQSWLGQNITAADGRAIVEMIKDDQNLDHLKNGGYARLHLENKTGMLTSKNSLCFVIEQKTKLTPFALAALLQFLQFANEGHFDKVMTLEICKPLLTSVLSNLDPSLLQMRRMFAPEPLPCLGRANLATPGSRQAPGARGEGYPIQRKPGLMYRYRPLRYLLYSGRHRDC
jgi:hypothetical protein